MGEAFALAAPAVWGLAVVLFRRSGETMPPAELNLLKNVVALTMMLPTLLIWGGPLPAFDGPAYLLMFASGFLGIAVGDTLYFRAVNMIGASRSGIVGGLLSPFVIILAAIFLGERLGGWQWLGFALVMAGILLVTWKRERHDVPADQLRKGAAVGAAGVLLMAVGVIMVKSLLEQNGFAWVVTIRLVGGAVGVLLLMALGGKLMTAMENYRKPHPWTWTLAGCFLGGYLAMILWLAGYKLIPASEASIYNEAQASFIVLFAWLILGERISVRRLAGLALTLVGVLTMLLA